MNATTDPSAQTEFRAAALPLAASIYGNALSKSGLLFYSMGTLAGPMSKEFGWSLSKFSLGVLFLNGTNFLTLPLTGYLLDRFGARRITPIAFIFMALISLGISRMGSSIWVYYGLLALFPLLGGGSSLLAYVRVVTSWFIVGRGRALGLVASATGVMTVVGAPTVAAVVQNYGWRTGWFLMAGSFLSAALVMFFFLREAHECKPGQPHMQRAVQQGDSLAQALAAPVFWLITASFSLVGLTVGGITFLIVPFMTTEGGMSPVRAATYVSLFGIASFVSRLGLGWIFDRIHAALVCAAIFFVGGLGFATLAIGGPALAPIGILIAGIVLGAEIDAQGYLIAWRFGLKNQGKILGMSFGILGLFTGSGAFMVTSLREYFGTFAAPLFVMAALAFAAAVLLMIVTRFKFPPRSQA